MINTYDSKRNLVIPKWLTFAKAAKTKELSIPRNDVFKINQATQRQLEIDYLDFKKDPSPHKAADLMGSAAVIGANSIAIEMAKFVKSKSILQKPTLELADKIINPSYQDLSNFKYQVLIAKIKSSLSDFPKNAIGWIELARLYTIKGQISKARKAVLVALNLAPYDRYIVRCSARFFLLIREIDSAWHYIHKALQYYADPWIKAVEITISVIMEKRIKKFNPKSISENDIFHYSELIEGFGMVELLSGNESKARKNFKLAWSNPSRNVITHGEWIIRNKFPGLAESASLDFTKSLEALAWQYYYKLELAEAISTVRHWELEEPYSPDPYLLGSTISCDAGIPEEGVEFALRGLTANPKDFFINNNLAFSLLKAGKIADAEKIIKRFQSNLEEENRIYYLATKGLLEFKKGNIRVGRDYYKKSIHICNQINNNILSAKASLCLALAEVADRTKEAIEATKKALGLSEKIEKPDIILARKELQDKYMALVKDNFEKEAVNV